MLAIFRSLFFGDGFAHKFTVQGHLEKWHSVILCHVGDALDVELEDRIFEEEVDIFQIGLDILGERCATLCVEVVFNLDLAVLEDLGVTL